MGTEVGGAEPSPSPACCCLRCKACTGVGGKGVGERGGGKGGKGERTLSGWGEGRGQGVMGANKQPPSSATCLLYKLADGWSSPTPLLPHSSKSCYLYLSPPHQQLCSAPVPRSTPISLHSHRPKP